MIMRYRLILFLLVAVLVGEASRTTAAGPDPSAHLQREHLMTFTGAGRTGGEPITLYLDGFERVPRIGNQRLTIGTGQSFRMCVVQEPDGAVYALDILEIRRDAERRVRDRSVERLPLSDLREGGVRFRVDPGWLAGIFIRDPVVFRMRVTEVKKGSGFTMRIHYLNNYDKEVRKTLVLHARSGASGWKLIRHRPVDHEIESNLHLVSRQKVNGVRIETAPVEAEGTLHPDRGE